MTQKDIIEKIESIANKSTEFKIGETGMSLTERLANYSEFEQIEGIIWSSDKSTIDYYESLMNDHFINHPKNKNLKTGSAGEMNSKSERFILYVVYNTK